MPRSSPKWSGASSLGTAGARACGTSIMAFGTALTAVPPARKAAGYAPRSLAPSPPRHLRHVRGASSQPAGVPPCDAGARKAACGADAATSVLPSLQLQLLQTLDRACAAVQCSGTQPAQTGGGTWQLPPLSAPSGAGQMGRDVRYALVRPAAPAQRADAPNAPLRVPQHMRGLLRQPPPCRNISAACGGSDWQLAGACAQRTLALPRLQTQLSTIPEDRCCESAGAGARAGPNSRRSRGAPVPAAAPSPCRPQPGQGAAKAHAAVPNVQYSVQELVGMI